jgi:hypothetical protein
MYNTVKIEINKAGVEGFKGNVLVRVGLTEEGHVRIRPTHRTGGINNLKTEVVVPVEARGDGKLRFEFEGGNEMVNIEGEHFNMVPQKYGWFWLIPGDIAKGAMGGKILSVVSDGIEVPTEEQVEEAVEG